MGENSKIEWTHHTFNPVLGCTKVHAGCTNCYAETEQAIVMRKGGRINWGEVWQGGDRVVVADSTWAKPLSWGRAAAKAGERHRIFCASLSDVLEVPRLPEKWPSGWDEKQIAWATERVQRIGAEMELARERLWDIIRKTAHWCEHCSTDGSGCEDGGYTGTGLDWLLLTKRPENWRLVPEDVRPLVWLGTSISDQATADEWVPRLLAAEGFRYRFLSVEPLVGPVDLSRWFYAGHHPSWDGHPDRTPQRRLSWVIVGGESGPKARPCNIEWIRSIVKQCAESGVPCFVKQLGTYSVTPNDSDRRNNFWSQEWPDMLRVLHVTRDADGNQVRDQKGGDWDAWPSDLRVREFPR